MLRQVGYAVEDNVRFAQSVTELCGIFDAMPNRAPNMVICDFRLRAGETARDVLRVLDERFDWQPVPVVIYSAEIQPQIDLERRYLRVVGKSADPSLLLTEVEALLVQAKRDWLEEEGASGGF